MPLVAQALSRRKITFSRFASPGTFRLLLLPSVCPAGHGICPNLSLDHPEATRGTKFPDNPTKQGAKLCEAVDLVSTHQACARSSPPVQVRSPRGSSCKVRSSSAVVKRFGSGSFAPRASKDTRVATRPARFRSSSRRGTRASTFGAVPRFLSTFTNRSPAEYLELSTVSPSPSIELRIVSSSTTDQRP